MTTTNLSAITTMALFNLTLNLELVIPNENSKSLNITEKWNWEDIMSLSYPNVSREWIESVEIWYMPLMSTSAALQLRRYFTGKSISFNETIVGGGDWINFCGTETWEDSIAILKGFNESQPIKCYIDGKSTLNAWNCTYWSDKLKEPSLMSGVLSHTDNFKYEVEIRVWENQIKDWILYSTEKVISNETKSEVLQHVRKFGFDPTSIFTVDYSKCAESSDVE